MILKEAMLVIVILLLQLAEAKKHVSLERK